jgi:proteasome lid subunit RPN8/RPN11
MSPKRRQSDSLQRLASDLEHQGQADRSWQAADGRHLHVTITVFTGSWYRGWPHRVGITVSQRSACCASCRETICRLERRVTLPDLEALIEDAWKIFLDCSNQCQATPLEVEAQPEAVSPQPRVRVTPDADENRIKVITKGSSTGNSSPSSQQPDSPEVISIKKPNVKVLPEQSSSTGVVISRPQQRELQAAARHVYSAPSIRYRVKHDHEVEVTIPRYLCEQVAHHCAESARTRYEVGGILVGYTSKTPRPAVGGSLMQNNVTDLLQVKSNNRSNSHLAIDHNEWARIGSEFEQMFGSTEKVYLGWYHTHPTQGIFFSPQDRDTHTNFTLPHQFALVVDPRSMFAGLFAWQDHERRLMVESEPFPLKLRREGGDSNNDQRNDRDNSPKSADISSWRIFWFGMILVSVICYVVVSSEGNGLGPNQAILLALTSFLGLRLWNARFFTPAFLVEKEFVRGVSRSMRGGSGLLTRTLGQHPRVARALTVAIGVVVVLGVGFLGAWLYGRVSSQGTPIFQNQTLNNSTTPVSTPVPTNIVLTAKKLSDTKLQITSPDPSVEIVYSRQDTKWQPDGETREQRFLLAIFGWDLKTSDPIFSGTQEMPADRGGTQKFEFAKWDDVGRDRFILKLMDWKEAGGKVLVKKTAGDARVSFR